MGGRKDDAYPYQTQTDCEARELHTVTGAPEAEVFELLPTGILQFDELIARLLNAKAEVIQRQRDREPARILKGHFRRDHD